MCPRKTKENNELKSVEINVVTFTKFITDGVESFCNNDVDVFVVIVDIDHIGDDDNDDDDYDDDKDGK